MIVERKGIRLVRLTEDKIELVRQKRNLPEIQSAMEFRQHITPEMQQKWFVSVDNINNYYFLIYAGDKQIGLISATNIDWETKIINNGGVFIWDKEYLESAAVMHASLLLTDTGFCMGIKKNYIKILSTNRRSIAYNTGMGYELMPGQEDILNQKYELQWESYFNKTERVRRLLNIEQTITMTVTGKEYEDNKVAERVLARPLDDTRPVAIEVVVLTAK